MKVALAILLVSRVVVTEAFLPLVGRAAASNILPLSSSSSGESDFSSAMPEAPVLTVKEKLVNAATEYMAYVESELGEGVAPPPELEVLREARDNEAEPSIISARMYELMIERGMIYDQDEDGVLTPTKYVITENLDEPAVKSEFSHLYRYGMNLISNGLLTVDTVKDIVKERLIDRTGKTPEEFDEWLGF